jgi:ABC-type phosphate/phosphonate transport system substrate-binding protein
VIANARMYAVNAATAAAWRALLADVLARAKVDAEVIDHPFPQPLPALWARDDLACAFMCGYPYARSAPRPTLLAAPVQDDPRCEGRPVYWTDIVARADGPIRTLDDLAGRRFGYTTPDSQSGYQAPRVLLAPLAAARGGRLFASVVGPLVTPRRVVEAVVAGDADAGPVDSYALRLLRDTEPALVAPLHVVASTPPTPCPPLVASASLPAAIADRLRDALLDTGPVAALGLAGFARVAPREYDALAERADAVDISGYRALG